MGDLLHRSALLSLSFTLLLRLRAEGGCLPARTCRQAGFLSCGRTMRTPVESPSIGVLLCESRSGPIVEFALENTNQPIGVSTYQVTRELPAPMQEELPSVEDLQEVVNKRSFVCRAQTDRRGAAQWNHRRRRGRQPLLAFPTSPKREPGWGIGSRGSRPRSSSRSRTAPGSKESGITRSWRCCWTAPCACSSWPVWTVTGSSDKKA